jgi:Zn-dependent peptidase ImmA (M78 family)
MPKTIKRFQDMTEDERRNETEANLFALALLMPESHVRERIEADGGVYLSDGGEQCKRLAKIFRVDEHVMAFRLGQLYAA